MFKEQNSKLLVITLCLVLFFQLSFSSCGSMINSVLENSLKENLKIVPFKSRQFNVSIEKLDKILKKVVQSEGFQITSHKHDPEGISNFLIRVDVLITEIMAYKQLDGGDTVYLEANVLRVDDKNYVYLVIKKEFSLQTYNKKNNEYNYVKETKRFLIYNRKYYINIMEKVIKEVSKHKKESKPLEKKV